MVFDFLKRKDKDEQFKKDFVLTEESRPQPDDSEYTTALQRQGPMLIDENINKIILHYPCLYPYLAALSHVSRTTKHISKLDTRIQWIDLQLLHIMVEMDMSQGEMEEVGLAFLQGMEMFGNTLISDGYEGWKGRILTEQAKTFKIDMEKKSRF